MVLSAFFSGMEIAFVSSNRMRAEMDKEKSVFTQKLLSVFYSHPNGFVSTMLVGNNIVLVVYGILFAKFFDKTLFAPLDDGMRVAADTVFSTIVVLFTGEFLPKTLFKNNANKLLTLFSPIAYFFYIVLWPISKFSTLSAKFLLRLVGKRMEKEDDDEGFSKVDLDYLVHSSLDNAKADSPEWKEHVCQMPFVPESMAAQKLMKTFLQEKKSLGVVVDEFGGTSGIVALEDIVEEIFGDIEDEHDSTKYIAKQLDNGEYLLSARLEIDKVNEMFDLGLPESDEYMTISGLILHYYESFPKLNEIVTIGKFEFKIIKNTMTKIVLVQLKVNA